MGVVCELEEKSWQRTLKAQRYSKKLLSICRRLSFTLLSEQRCLAFTILMCVEVGYTPVYALLLILTYQYFYRGMCVHGDREKINNTCQKGCKLSQQSLQLLMDVIITIIPSDTIESEQYSHTQSNEPKKTVLLRNKDPF